MATTTKTEKLYLTLVDQWLDTLPAADAEDFREFAEITPSGCTQESLDMAAPSMTYHVG